MYTYSQPASQWGQSSPTHLGRMTVNNLGWDPYPGRFKVCDGRVVTVIAGLLLSTKHIVELQLPSAGAKHQEPLPG